jgi:hypothetical protein
MFLEQVADHRDVSQERNLGHVLLILEFIHATDDNRLPILHQHCGVDLPLGNVGDLAEACVSEPGHFIFFDIHVQENSSIIGNRGRDFELEKRFLHPYRQ